MQFFLPFIFGFMAAVVGIIPPGLINLTAAKISLIDGKKTAMKFVFGALTVIIVQTFISVFFAQYINRNQEIIILIREIGLVIFVILSIYFLKFAKKTAEISEAPKVIKTKRSRFLIGMLVSAINFFPIPYYVLYFITNMNKMIGTITGIVALFTLFHLLKMYFNGR